MPAGNLAAFQSLASHPQAQRAVRRHMGPLLDEAKLERLVEIGDLVSPAVGTVLADTWNRGHNDGLKPSAYLGPTLVVRGGKDPFVTKQLVFKSVLPRFTTCSERIVPLAGHWPHVEQPGALARILIKFLRSLDQTAGDRNMNSA